QDNALAIEPGGGAQQIIGAFSSLKLGGVKHDRAIVLDAKPCAQLFALAVRELRVGHEATVVDCVRHIENSPLWYPDRPEKFPVRGADREDAVEPAVIGPDQWAADQVFDRRSAQAEMRLTT